MKFEKCRECAFVCTCCSSRETKKNCKQCNSMNFNEGYRPAGNIHYCSKDGEKIEDWMED